MIRIDNYISVNLVIRKTFSRCNDHITLRESRRLMYASTFVWGTSRIWWLQGFINLHQKIWWLNEDDNCDWWLTFEGSVLTVHRPPHYQNCQPITIGSRTFLFQTTRSHLNMKVTKTFCISLHLPLMDLPR